MDGVAVAPRQRRSAKVYVGTVVCVVVVAVCVTWAFWSMRAVMEIGGACADGGPYVSAAPCPDGAALIAIAVPVMIATAIFGSAVATAAGAPNLLVPMWGALFGALGWNFLEYGVQGPGVVWGWLVCGVVFWAMAAPAVLLVVLSVKNAAVPPAHPSPLAGDRWWVPAYAALGAAGFLLGSWSWNAIS
jgi:hypothetical protein